MRPFPNIHGYGDGDIVHALILLDEPYPTDEELELVRDRYCYPTLYSAIDVLIEDYR